MPWCFFVFVSSSSPAGGSPVRVAARRPVSRLVARPGNGPGRSPASRALQGERRCGPQHDAKPAASLLSRPPGWAKGVPSLSKSGRRPWKRCRAWSAAVRDSPAHGPKRSMVPCPRPGPRQRLVTRAVTTSAPIRPGQTVDPRTRPGSHLRNAGRAGRKIERFGAPRSISAYMAPEARDEQAVAWTAIAGQ